MSRLAGRTVSLLAACCALSTGATAFASADNAASASTPLTAQWQHQSRTLNFQGFTSQYTCDGIEDKIRQILVYLGARSDAKVRASCAYGPNKPSPYASVSMEFDTLAATAAPAAGGSAPTESVSARWQPVELSSRRPSFMGSGECELVEQLKPVLKASFALEGLDYNTRCIPHQVTLGDYNVRGRALQASPVK
jgi:hypothetical protein